MDILTLSQSKKYTNLVALGLSDVRVEGASVIFTLNDGSSATITFPAPADGVSVIGLDINGNNELIITLSDGTTINAGTIMASTGVSGKDAYEIAVDEGFVGTRKEWLNSLKATASVPSEIGDIPITGDLIPDTNGAYSIGSEERKLKAIHAEEIYMSANTLYIDGTPVFHTNDNDDILVSADEGQSINIKTAGIANTNVLSDQAVQIKTTKEASNVNICAGDVSTGSTSNVNINASNNISEICNNQITQKAPYIVEEAVNGVAIRGGLNVDNLTVVNNLVVKGETFKVDATDMEVKDNIIVVNKGESGSGVSKGTAGIRIDRGDAPAYNFLFDEADDMFKIGEDNKLETVTTQEYVNGLVGNFASKDEIYIPTNKQTLDKLSENDEGTLLWNGEEIKGSSSIVNEQENEYKGFQIRFGIDENGNYGYIKDGADTVIPFKSGGSGLIPYNVIVKSVGVNKGHTVELSQTGHETVTGTLVDGGDGFAYSEVLHPMWSGSWSIKDINNSNTSTVDLKYFGDYTPMLGSYTYIKPSSWSVSSSHSPYNKDCLFDGTGDSTTSSNTTNSWLAAAGSSASWIRFNYTKTILMQKVVVQINYMGISSSVPTIKLQYSTDASTWVDLSSAVTVGKKAITLTANKQVTAKYFRILSSSGLTVDASTHYTMISEITPTGIYAE